MTMNILNQIIEENDIPQDVHFMSDSGWECDPTEMDGVFYHRKSNTIVFTQESFDQDYAESDEWEVLYLPGLIKLEELYICPTTNYSMAGGVTEVFKKEIKAAGDFESYYGTHETDDAYNRIDLCRPLFYCIKIKRNFIGYIGFNGAENILEPEIYIFKQYRNKGYGTRVLNKFIDIAFKDGLLKEWREENKDDKPPKYIRKKKLLIPSKIVSTVRVENVNSRRMMKVCGFEKNKEFAAKAVAFINEDNERDFDLIDVVEYYLTKEKYLSGNGSGILCMNC